MEDSTTTIQNDIALAAAFIFNEMNTIDEAEDAMLRHAIQMYDAKHALCDHRLMSAKKRRIRQ